MTSFIFPQGIDETHAECVARVRQANRYALKPAPLDHDFHVTAWRMATWDSIFELAWLRRQEKALYDGY